MDQYNESNNIGSNSQMARPVQPNIQSQAPPPQQPRYQQYPPRGRPRVSILNLVLIIVVIILLIGVIISMAMYSAEIESLNDELDDNESDLNGVENELEVTKSTLNNIQIELNDTKQDLQNLEDDYKDLEDEHEDLEADYNELQDDYDKLVIQNQNNQEPHVSVIPSTTTAYQTESITFDARGSNDVDGEIIEYRWDFGNGDLESWSDYIVYSYDEIGEYTVRLTITDNNNSKNSTTEVITVTNAIVITITGFTQDEYYPDEYEIVLTFKNNGDRTANTDEAYWSMKTTGGSSHAPYDTWGLLEVDGGETEDFRLDFYYVDSIPDRLVYSDPPFYQEVVLVL